MQLIFLYQFHGYYLVQDDRNSIIFASCRNNVNVCQQISVVGFVLPDFIYICRSVFKT